MTLMTEGKTLEGGGGVAPEAAMPQIEKGRSLAEPNRLPAGPRKKRPLGRLFSSFRYFYKNNLHFVKIKSKTWRKTTKNLF